MKKVRRPLSNKWYLLIIHPTFQIYRSSTLIFVKDNSRSVEGEWYELNSNEAALLRFIHKKAYSDEWIDSYI